MSESHYGDFRQRRQETVWHSLNRLMMTLIIFAVCILVICAFLPLLKKQRELSGRVADLKAEIEKRKLTLSRASREENLLRHDPAYLEAMAYDRLDMMKEGDTIFRLDPPPMPDKSTFKLNR